MSGEKAPASVASWLDPARAADLKRYKDLAPAAIVGARLPLVAGAPVLGFHPVDYAGAFSFRWIGPDPKALLFVGKRDAKVASALLVLAGAIPAGVGAPRLFWNDAALAVEAAAAPEAFLKAYPRATALRAALPAGAGEASILAIRLDRTVPDPGQDPPTRLVGLPLHAVVFA